jgi:dTDP-4-dehydrorhamnose reductase
VARAAGAEGVGERLGKAGEAAMRSSSSGNRGRSPGARAAGRCHRAGPDEADLCDPAACAAAIRAHAPEAVINAAAYTGVDKAEEEEDLATTINGAAPDGDGETCAELGIPFVHISTDYVFDGSATAPCARCADSAPGGLRAFQAGR